MKLYNKFLIILLATISINAQNLKEILQLTINNNQNIQASKLIQNSQLNEYKSTKNIFNPSLNVGANLNILSGDVSVRQVGTTMVGFVKASINIYDGGKNSAIKTQKLYDYRASQNSTYYLSRQLLLRSVTIFFQIKSIQAQIQAYENKSKTLIAQVAKEELKYKISMSTEDILLKFKAELATNDYTITELNYQVNNLLQNLSLIAGVPIVTLDDTVLPELSNLSFKPSNNIEVQENSIKSIDQNIKILKSSKRPQISISDSYNIYSYEDYDDTILSNLPSQQNQLMFSINFNLFDASYSSKLQSAILAKQAKIQNLNYLKDQEKMNFILTEQRLKTIKSKIKAIKSSVEMANKVFEIIEEKYQNSIVDNITYLDALNKKTTNEALLSQVFYEYEIAKANYYFSSGIDYRDVLKYKFD